MFTEDKGTEIFFMADEFHKVFCRMLDKYSLNAPKIAGKSSYHRAGKLSVPEIMTIMILFHNSGYRCLKHFYLNEVCVNLRHHILVVEYTVKQVIARGIVPQALEYSIYVQAYLDKPLCHLVLVRAVDGLAGIFAEPHL